MFSLAHKLDEKFVPHICLDPQVWLKDNTSKVFLYFASTVSKSLCSKSNAFYTVFSDFNVINGTLTLFVLLEPLSRLHVVITLPVLSILGSCVYLSNLEKRSDERLTLTPNGSGVFISPPFAQRMLSPLWLHFLYFLCSWSSLCPSFHYFRLWRRSWN